MYLDKAKQLLAETQIVAPNEIYPCTDSEVRALERQIGHHLPEAYREFLLWMGHGAGSLLRGTDFFFQDLSGHQEGAIALLRENDLIGYLPDDGFVFYMHQGYQFMFLRTSEGDDPPVYYFGEGEGLTSWVQRYDHFSRFLLTEIDGHARILAQCRSGALERHEQEERLRRQRHIGFR